jgi:hypothetical protein
MEEHIRTEAGFNTDQLRQNEELVELVAHKLKLGFQ